MTITELANVEKTAAVDLYVALVCGNTEPAYTFQCVRKLRHIIDDIEHTLSMEQLGLSSDLKGLAERENQV